MVFQSVKWHTLLCGSSQDNWQIKQLSNGGMRNDALLVGNWLKVSDSVVKAILEIDDKENSLLFVESFVRICFKKT